MAKKNTGKDSEEIFVEKLEEKYKKDVFIFRLTDTNEIKGTFATGFVKANPSDYVVTIRGVMFYAEVKSCSDKRASFSFGKFTKMQNISMIKQHIAGGFYYVFIHNLDTDIWYIVSVEQIIERKQKGQKSMKWSEMTKWEWKI